MTGDFPLHYRMARRWSNHRANNPPMGLVTIKIVDDRGVENLRVLGLTKFLNMVRQCNNGMQGWNHY